MLCLLLGLVMSVYSVYQPLDRYLCYYRVSGYWRLHIREMVIIQFWKSISKDIRRHSVIPSLFLKSTSSGIMSSNLKRHRWWRGSRSGKFRFISTEPSLIQWIIAIGYPSRVLLSCCILWMMISSSIAKLLKQLLPNLMRSIKIWFWEESRLTKWGHLDLLLILIIPRDSTSIRVMLMPSILLSRSRVLLLFPGTILSYTISN